MKQNKGILDEIILFGIQIAAFFLILEAALNVFVLDINPAIKYI